MIITSTHSLRYLLSAALLLMILSLSAQQNRFGGRLSLGVGNQYQASGPLQGIDGTADQPLSFQPDFMQYHAGLEWMARPDLSLGMQLRLSPRAQRVQQGALVASYFTDNGYLLSNDAVVAPLLRLGVSFNEPAQNLLIPAGAGLKFRLSNRWSLQVSYDAYLEPGWFTAPFSSSQSGATALLLQYSFERREHSFRGPVIYTNTPTLARETTTEVPESTPGKPNPVATMDSSDISERDSNGISEQFRQHYRRKLQSGQLDFRPRSFTQRDSTADFLQPRARQQSSSLQDSVLRALLASNLRMEERLDNRDRMEELERRLQALENQGAEPTSSSYDNYSPPASEGVSDSQLEWLRKDVAEHSRRLSELESEIWNLNNLPTGGSPTSQATPDSATQSYSDSLLKGESARIQLALDSSELASQQLRLELRRIKAREKAQAQKIDSLERATASQSVQSSSLPEMPISETKIFFATNSSRISITEKERLQSIIALSKRHPSLKFRILGYTDRSGSADYNEQLAEKRVQAVAQQLRAAGLPAERLETENRGPDTSLPPGRSPLGRRVEIHVMK